MTLESRVRELERRMNEADRGEYTPHVQRIIEDFYGLMQRVKDLEDEQKKVSGAREFQLSLRQKIVFGLTSIGSAFAIFRAVIDPPW